MSFSLRQHRCFNLTHRFVPVSAIYTGNYGVKLLHETEKMTLEHKLQTSSAKQSYLQSQSNILSSSTKDESITKHETSNRISLDVK